MDMLSFLFLGFQLSFAAGDSIGRFVRTNNISVASFSQFTSRTLRTASPLECSSKCVYFQMLQKNICNSFTYSAGECTLAWVRFLENTDVGEVSEDIYVDVSKLSSMTMVCRGAENCCHRSYSGLCGEGEGDCNNDNDCQGSLVCGENNCLRYHVAGGLWGPEDDCCERKCTPEHPCDEGEGTCSTDADCQNPGYLKCGTYCINPTYFPRTEFHQNTETYFNSTDKCCYRVCNKNHKICSNNQIGCLHDSDCRAGYRCRRENVTAPYCTDINECDENICGSLENGNSTCTNTVGSYSCSCKSGYTDLTLYDGCRELNECSENYYSVCGYSSYVSCYNTPPGSFSCVCDPGFYWTGSSCYDINECSRTPSPCPAGVSCVNSYGSYSCVCPSYFKSGSNCGCEASLVAEYTDTAGVLTSPNYPSNYPSGTLAYWSITVPPGYHIHISLDYFQTESCCDAVWIMTDSCSAFSPMLVSKLGGTNTGDNYSTPVGSNAAFVQFRSDSSVNYKGFSISWTAIED